MRARLIAVLITLVAVVVLVVAGGLWVVGTGAYDVSATTEHWAVTRWALDELRERSVARRVGEIPVALPDGPEALDGGFEHFHEMCQQCHGAPGYDRGEVGQGMNPRPPRLERVADRWTDAELFYITKHGIRMAGMPAFGPTHSDRAIAEIVAFVRALPEMTEEEYARRVRALQEDRGD